jgi:hypothetical protein
MHEAKAGSGEPTRHAVPDAKAILPGWFRWLRSTLCPDSTASYLGWGALSAL